MRRRVYFEIAPFLELDESFDGFEFAEERHIRDVVGGASLDRQRVDQPVVLRRSPVAAVAIGWAVQRLQLLVQQVQWDQADQFPFNRVPTLFLLRQWRNRSPLG